jgi:hypothetical protein
MTKKSSSTIWTLQRISPPSTPVVADVRRGLEILQQLGLSSTAKFVKMREWACPADGRARGGILYHGASPLTGDHEALTPAGWVRLDEWAGGDIACWASDGTMSFKPATPVQFSAPETLVAWRNQKVDQLSTADHAMPVFCRERRSPVSDRVWGGGFARKTTATMSPGDRIPLCGQREGRSWPLSDVQTRVLVMTQADAHYVRADGRAILYGFKKDRKIQRCMALLHEAGVTFRMRRDATGKTVITVPYKWAPSWLWEFSDKTFSWEWINAPADVVFSELPLWDGCKSSPQGIDYSTGNKQNADVIQALAHLSGRTCGVTARDRSTQGWNTSYRCFIDNDPTPVTFRCPQRRTVKTGDAFVYCAQTPTGYFLVRRNGRAWITGNTGRFSGAGIQPHNFPKGFLKEEKCPMTAIWVDILTLEKAQVEAKYGCSMLKLLSHALRGAITARNGRHLFVADYASIEVRVLLWLAEDEAHLDMLRKGVDMYVDMASKIYNKRLTKEDKTERGLGKVAVLGLGYQMGASKFVDSAKLMAGVEITEEFSKTVVDTYRAEYWRVKSLWYDCEEAAIAAVENPGEPQSAGRVVYVVEDSRFLFCYLPSGRRLAYPFPEIQERKTPWGAVKNALTYMGVDQYTRKWRRQVSYGGLLVENCLAGHTQILTARGWITLSDLQPSDWVWDGYEWVAHGGLVDRGVQETVIVDGVTLTADHPILTTKGWVSAAKSEGLDWVFGRAVYYSGMPRVVEWPLALAGGVRAGAYAHLQVPGLADDQGSMRGLSGRTGPTADTSPSRVGQHEDALLQSTGTVIPQLRRAGHYCLRAMGVVREFLDRYVPFLRIGADDRTRQQRRRLLPGELPLGYSLRPDAEYSSTETQTAVSGDSGCTWPWYSRRIQSILPGPAVRVYDILNCGPRQQFMIDEGRIVHNCTQAVARDIMAEGLLRVAQTRVYEPVLSIHDEAVAEAHPLLGDVHEFERLLSEPPAWALDCPIAAEGWSGPTINKDGLMADKW